MKDYLIVGLKILLSLLVAIIIVLVSADQSFGWGFWAHKEINKRAIQLLPPPMKQFFLSHEHYVTEHAIDPDLRRSRGDSLEPFNHYIDIDYYGTYPFEALPRNYDSAVAKFSIDTVRKQGILPWRIAAFTDSLSNAMKRRETAAILHFSADLGHYVADSHVPLHAVIDYDGVLRGQKGVHKRWESDLTERFAQSYTYPTQGAIFIDNPLMYAFNTILESYTYSDSVLKADAEAERRVPGAKRIKSVSDKGDTAYIFSDAYYDSLRVLDKGLVEGRMHKSIISVACYWYTAWVKAGKPELPTDGGK